MCRNGLTQPACSAWDILRAGWTAWDETQMLREYASQISTEYQAQIDIAQNGL